MGAWAWRCSMECNYRGALCYVVSALLLMCGRVISWRLLDAESAGSGVQRRSRTVQTQVQVTREQYGDRGVVEMCAGYSISPGPSLYTAWRTGIRLRRLAGISRLPRPAHAAVWRH